MSESDTNTETLEEEVARLKSQLADARSEAAKNRVAKRTAVEEAKAQLEADLKAEHEAALAKLKTEHGDVEAQFNESKLRVARLQAALNSVFDETTVERVSEMASRLVGSTEEELKADAERAKALFGLDSKPNTPAVDPSQGSGNATPLNGDPLLKMMTNVLNRRQ